MRPALTQRCQVEMLVPQSLAASALVRRSVTSGKDAPFGTPCQGFRARFLIATEVARVSGGNIVLVQQLLGHSSPSTTQRYVGWSAPGATTVAALYQ